MQFNMRSRSGAWQDATLVFYVSVNKLVQTGDYGVIIDFRVDST